MAAIKKIKLPRVTTPYDILDANAVHTTGDEEINGKKTFILVIIVKTGCLITVIIFIFLIPTQIFKEEKGKAND